MFYGALNQIKIFLFVKKTKKNCDFFVISKRYNTPHMSYNLYIIITKMVANLNMNATSYKS